MNRNEIFISSTMLSATELNLTLIVTKIRTNTVFLDRVAMYKKYRGNPPLKLEHGLRNKELLLDKD